MGHGHVTVTWSCNEKGGEGEADGRSCIECESQKRRTMSDVSVWVVVESTTAAPSTHHLTSCCAHRVLHLYAKEMSSLNISRCSRCMKPGQYNYNIITYSLYRYIRHELCNRVHILVHQ